MSGHESGSRRRSARFVTGASGDRSDSARRYVPKWRCRASAIAVDPRSAPEIILRGHAPNQISGGWIDAWPARALPRATAPASTHAVAVPTIHGGRLNQRRRFPPLGPPPPQTQPQQMVSRAEAPIRTSEDAELVAQRNRLEQEISARRPSRWEDSIGRDDSPHR